MSRKYVLILVVMLVLACIPAMSAVVPKTSAPAVQFVPVYPGSSIEMETNLTDKDFLPIVRQWLTLMPGIVSSIVIPNDPAIKQEIEKDPRISALMQACNEKSLKDLEIAISGLKLISAIQYSIPKNADQNKLADFYMQKLGLSKEWTLTLRVEDPKGTMRLYSKPDFEGLFGYVISPEKVMAFRTQGKIDLVSVSNWVTKIIPIIIESTKVQVPENTDQTAPQVQSETPQPQQVN
ncbi:MAG: hypothetical protein ACYC27_19220 [Armatimonadota bacterium]